MPYLYDKLCCNSFLIKRLRNVFINITKQKLKKLSNVKKVMLTKPQESNVTFTVTIICDVKIMISNLRIKFDNNKVLSNLKKSLQS